MKTWPQPRILNLSAAALFAAGIGLLYAGALKLAPVALFAAVVLCVLAAIATTAYDIERLQTAPPVTLASASGAVSPEAAYSAAESGDDEVRRADGSSKRDD